MERKKVWIVGHKNPDTDSICAAIAYANLKNKTDDAHLYFPKRAGEVNAETAYVLRRFGVEAPEYVDNVGTQLKDIAYSKTMGVSGQISMKKAWELMNEMKVVTLPVINDRNKLEGLIVTGDIAKSYMDVYDSHALSTARTQYRNIMETLAGTIMTGNDHGYFVRGKVIVATGSAEVTRKVVEHDDLVIIGDNEETQLVCIEAGCSCLIITNGQAISARVLTEAVRHEVVIISTPYDSYTVARLINQSIPIKYFMTKDNIVCFELDDYVDEVRETTAKIRYRAFPLLDENQNYVGIFSRRNLLDTQKKQVILVDHNEKSQAVDNIEEAEILEIVDHHRLGTLETMAPVYFRNQPLGCTSTIIYQMYLERGVKIEPDIAGLMCAAILSDTLLFRSPTCTEADVEAATALARIADIEMEAFANEMFRAGSDFDHKTEEEILSQDFKVFCLNDITIGVSQISTMSVSELDKIHGRIKRILPMIMIAKRVDMVLVMLTDIMSENTRLVFFGTGAKELMEETFTDSVADEDSILVRGMVSRKKQLIPALMKTLSERLN